MTFLSDKIHDLLRKRIYYKGNLKEKALWHDYARMRNLRGDKIRLRMAARLKKKTSAVLSLPDWINHYGETMQKQGFVRVHPNSFPFLDEALEEAREDFKRYKPGTNKREYDSLEGVPRSHRSYSTAINRFAMHPLLLRFVSDYLGVFPVLYRINLLYSPNQEDVSLSSQFWHFDPEDVRQVKVFVAVEDVDQDSGPLSVIPAELSAKVRKKTRFRNQRITDEKLFTIIPRGSAAHFTGKSGTLFFCDTSRCLHMGSRRASKPRFHMMIQYLMPHAVSFPAYGPLGKTPVGEKGVPSRASRFQKYLLGVVR